MAELAAVSTCVSAMANVYSFCQQFQDNYKEYKTIAVRIDILQEIIYPLKKNILSIKSNSVLGALDLLKGDLKELEKFLIWFSKASPIIRFSLTLWISRKLDQFSIKLDSKCALLNTAANVINLLTKETVLMSDEIDMRSVCLLDLQKNVYELNIIKQNKLGKGSFSDVYEGRYNGEQVAVKRFSHDPEDLVLDRDVKAEEDEVLMLSRLAKSPYIVACYGYTVENDRTLNMILEYAPYGSLGSSRFFSQLGKISVGLCLAWFCDIASALHFLHSRKVMHRDVKVFFFFSFSFYLSVSLSLLRQGTKLACI